MNYKDIQPYIDKGLISEQVHPENPDVRIFNYTQRCQFEKAWDDVTKQCRGLIMNVVTGEVIARPFPKFFNYEEHVQNSWPIPEGTPVISEKLDGSLGILYNLNGKPWIATRGSFMSDQAQWATAWWRANIGDVILNDETNLFEIIYPENRIVVSYDFSGLVYLTTIKTSTGEQIDRPWAEPLRTAKKIPFLTIEALKKLEQPNEEGFVIFFPKDNVRMKIKFAEYVRMHKIVTGISEIGIWEILRDGKTIKSLIENVPDEFFQWVSKVATDLLDRYDKIADECEKVYESIKKLPTRKEQAEAIKVANPPNEGVVFALLDKQGKKASAQIWRMLRPSGKHTYKIDIDS